MRIVVGVLVARRPAAVGVVWIYIYMYDDDDDDDDGDCALVCCYAFVSRKCAS